MGGEFKGDMAVLELEPSFQEVKEAAKWCGSFSLDVTWDDLTIRAYLNLSTSVPLVSLSNDLVK